MRVISDNVVNLQNKVSFLSYGSIFSAHTLTLYVLAVVDFNNTNGLLAVRNDVLSDLKVPI